MQARIHSAYLHRTLRSLYALRTSALSILDFSLSPATVEKQLDHIAKLEAVICETERYIAALEESQSLGRSKSISASRA